VGLDQSFPNYKDPCTGQPASSGCIYASLRSSSEHRFIPKVGEQYSVPNDNVDDSKVVEDVYVSTEAILTLQ